MELKVHANQIKDHMLGSCRPRRAVSFVDNIVLRTEHRTKKVCRVCRRPRASSTSSLRFFLLHHQSGMSGAFDRHRNVCAFPIRCAKYATTTTTTTSTYSSHGMHAGKQARHPHKLMTATVLLALYEHTTTRVCLFVCVLCCWWTRDRGQAFFAILPARARAQCFRTRTRHGHT